MQTTKIEVSNSTLLSLLRTKMPSIPATAKLYVRVPGGGDYSNTNLSLDEQHLIVEWDTKENDTTVNLKL